MHPNKRIQLEIYSCGDWLCGKLVWFKRPNDTAGSPLVDVLNSDPALRTRPLLGLVVLRNLRRIDDNTWEDGEIYNPDDGVDYWAEMPSENDGTYRLIEVNDAMSAGAYGSWTFEEDIAMSIKTFIFICAALTSMAVGAALAQSTGAPGTGTGPVATACKADIAKYCADKEHGQGEVRRCLQEHHDEVTPACRNALDTTGPRWSRPGN